MSLFSSRRAVVFIGMGLALTAGLAIAAFLLSNDPGPKEPPPASQGGLVVETGRDDDIKLDARRPLRCFVSGRLIGELPLSECARRNGVATGALDVGLDSSGALAAAQGASAEITPLPPQGADQTAGGDEAAKPPTQAVKSACWRYGGADWTRLPDPLTLEGCVEALYSGVCERGPPAYGRWGERTLRLVEGRVEVSPDNRNFRPLRAAAPGCPGTPQG